MIEDSLVKFNPNKDFTRGSPVCGEEIQGTMHLHRCIKPRVPDHLHLCYCGAFWPLSEFKNIADDAAKELFESLL
jgi:hypothetical protein